MSESERPAALRQGGEAPGAAEALIDWILSPCPPALFFGEIWERRTLHLQRDEAGYYDDLLPAEEIAAQLFANRNLALAPFKLFRGKEELAPQHFSERLGHGDLGASVVSPEKLKRALQQGYSLYLHFAERLFPRLAQALSRLERELGVKALSHLIVAPPNAQGFLPHTDPYGVLILQLSGQKSWRSYGIRDCPLGSQGLNHHYLEAEPAAENFEVRAGDLLYLPRGTAHAAATTVAPSIHLSLALVPPRGVDVVRVLEGLAERQAFFQGYAPYGLGASEEERAAYARRFKDRLVALIEAADLFELLERHHQGSGPVDPTQGDLLAMLRGGQGGGQDGGPGGGQGSSEGGGQAT